MSWVSDLFEAIKSVLSSLLGNLFDFVFYLFSLLLSLVNFLLTTLTDIVTNQSNTQGLFRSSDVFYDCLDNLNYFMPVAEIFLLIVTYFLLTSSLKFLSKVYWTIIGLIP
jgi:phosphotransferase system  glucose/maltose/N-acetylglucosamine-specific IIC component